MTRSNIHFLLDQIRTYQHRRDLETDPVIRAEWDACIEHDRKRIRAWLADERNYLLALATRIQSA